MKDIVSNSFSTTSTVGQYE